MMLLINGFVVECDYIYYNVLKSGVCLLVKIMVVELVEYVICVNVLCLGFVCIEFNEKIVVSIVFGFIEVYGCEYVLLCCVGLLDEIVVVYVFFVLDDVFFIIGIELVVDGG